MRGLLLVCLLAAAGCRSISAAEREAFHGRVAQIRGGIDAVRKAAAREPVESIRAERGGVLDRIEHDWEEARQVGEAALELRDRRALEYARDLLDDVDRRLSVLPR